MSKAATPVKDPRILTAIEYAAQFVPNPDDWGLHRSRHYFVEFNADEIAHFFPHDTGLRKFRVLFHMEVDTSTPQAAGQVATGDQKGVWVYQDYTMSRDADRGRVSKEALRSAREMQARIRDDMAKSAKKSPIGVGETPQRIGEGSAEAEVAQKPEPEAEVVQKPKPKPKAKSQTRAKQKPEPKDPDDLDLPPDVD